MLFTVNEDLAGQKGIVGNGVLEAPSVTWEAHWGNTELSLITVYPLRHYSISLSDILLYFLCALQCPSPAGKNAEYSLKIKILKSALFPFENKINNEAFLSCIM